MAVADVVGFRPTPEERAIIERTRRRLGFKTKAQALRHLVRMGDEADAKRALRSVLAYRVPKEFRGGPSTTSEEIDAALYGDP